jgi:hypothetical protein
LRHLDPAILGQLFCLKRKQRKPDFNNVVAQMANASFPFSSGHITCGTMLG